VNRQKAIAENMANMPRMIEEYRSKVRAFRRGDALSPIDRVILTPKQIRTKQKQQ